MSIDDPPGGEADDARWQQRWERTHELYLPGRDAAMSATLDLLAVAADGRPSRLLDLAGGPGPLAISAATRFPTIRVTLADIDPVLLALAAATIRRLGLDRRVEIVVVDLANPTWVTSAGGPFDAIVVVMALHWFEPHRIREIYEEAGRLLRPGGVFVNVDRIADPGFAEFTADIDAHRTSRRARKVGDGAETWETWWAAMREDHVPDLFAARDRLFADRSPSAECHPDLPWHLDALRAAGFSEAGVLWREHADAAVAATRPID